MQSIGRNRQRHQIGPIGPYLGIVYRIPNLNLIYTHAHLMRGPERKINEGKRPPPRCVDLLSLQFLHCQWRPLPLTCSRSHGKLWRGVKHTTAWSMRLNLQGEWIPHNIYVLCIFMFKQFVDSTLIIFYSLFLNHNFMTSKFHVFNHLLSLIRLSFKTFMGL